MAREHRRAHRPRIGGSAGAIQSAPGPANDDPPPPEHTGLGHGSSRGTAENMLFAAGNAHHFLTDSMIQVIFGIWQRSDDAGHNTAFDVATAALARAETPDAVDFWRKAAAGVVPGGIRDRESPQRAMERGIGSTQLTALLNGGRVPELADLVDTGFRPGFAGVYEAQLGETSGARALLASLKLLASRGAAMPVRQHVDFGKLRAEADEGEAAAAEEIWGMLLEGARR
ncbi:hypothetical protein DFJ74DRAFT_645341 [Hyaloraphidium curvatum]|nr:hypothetical protein DFJ74DRAFT_645341 [Hyaloraphidium curvatum]